MNLVDKIRQIILKLLVLSMLFQAWNPFNNPYLNPTLIFFYLYFLFSLLNFKYSFSIHHTKRFLVPLFILWLFMVIMTYHFYEPNTKNAFSILRNFLMQIVFFLLLINDLYNNQKLLGSLIKIYFLALLIFIVAYSFGLGVEYKQGRLFIFGTNPNMLGQLVVLGIILIISSIYDQNPLVHLKKYTLFFIPALLVILGVSGSRGAFLGLVIGLFIYLILYKNRLQQKIVFILLGVFFGGLSLYGVMQIDIMKTRFDQQAKDETYGGRTKIWKAAFIIVKENPVAGVGLARFEKEMKLLKFKGVAVHNEYLAILAYTGIIGLTIFLIFLITIVRGAIRYLRENGSPLLVSISVLQIFILFKGGGVLLSFITWFTFAIIAALSLPNRNHLHNISDFSNGIKAQ